LLRTECVVVPNNDHSQADMPSVSAPVQMSTGDQDNIMELASTVRHISLRLDICYFDKISFKNTICV